MHQVKKKWSILWSALIQTIEFLSMVEITIEHEYNYFRSD